MLMIGSALGLLAWLGVRKAAPVEGAATPVD
jgi:hypothetical protein